MYLFFELRQTDVSSLLLSKMFIISAVGIGYFAVGRHFICFLKLILHLFAPDAYRRDDKRITQKKWRKIMKNEKENTKDEVVIILPEPEIPPIKKITIFLLGVSSTLLMSAYINFNENLGLLALGILLFLFIFDEGFRRIF